MGPAFRMGNFWVVILNPLMENVFGNCGPVEGTGAPVGPFPPSDILAMNDSWS